MSRTLGASLTAGVVLFLAVGSAQAQTPPPYLYNRPNYGVGFRPRLNPYLDLANGGDPAINYYLGTLPELDRRATQRVYGSAINALAERALQPPPVSISDAELFTPLPTTGHPTTFGYTGPYFPAPLARPRAGAPTMPGLRRCAADKASGRREPADGLYRPARAGRSPAHSVPSTLPPTSAAVRRRPPPHRPSRSGPSAGRSAPGRRCLPGGCPAR